MRHYIFFDESVSLLSLTENLTVQQAQGWVTLNHLSAYMCPTYIIQVWGIAVYLCLGMSEPSVR
ncbi:MAG: hypothetical protein IKW05_05090 [Muribaculaceae bacterium]|nr:hypothetical protein [Muribaculaceae bacterium]